MSNSGGTHIPRLCIYFLIARSVFRHTFQAAGSKLVTACDVDAGEHCSA